MTELDGNPRPKVFGLGLSRSGTTSLNGALELLGYRAIHFPRVRFRATRLGARLGRRDLRLAWATTRRFDAISDITILPFYKELDARFPGSKFVLTVREKEAWLDSCANFRKFRPEFDSPPELLELRRLVYGTPFFDREAFATAYDRHHAEIRETFARRPGDLLELDVCSGEGFELLCPFLGVDVPDEPFPWQNRRPATHAVASS